MARLVERTLLTEDIYADFETGTCFRLVDDKVDDRYRHATIYEIIKELTPSHDGVPEPEVLFHVFGHDFSKIWRKPISYLNLGRDKGVFVILSEDEKRALFKRK